MNWIKVFRQGLTAFFIAILLLSSTSVDAAIEIFDGTGQYIMSDFENRDIAKQRAQQRAERDAQKKAGVALKTFSRSINSELSDDEISAVTNNIIKISDIEIVPVPFETKGEAGIMYRATLKATIDTDSIYAWNDLDEEEKIAILNQNKDLQEAIDKNDEQIEDLKEQYNRAMSQAEKDKIRQQMNDADRNFLMNQKFKKATGLYFLKNYDDALKLYNEVIELNPDVYSLYTIRGCIYLRLKRYEKSIQDFNKSLQLNKNYSEAYACRGYVYYELKKYKQAIKDYNEAIQIKPNNYLLYYTRGKAFFKIDKYEQAIKDFNKVIELEPSVLTIYTYRGFSYAFIGNFEQAIIDFNKVIELYPNSASLYRARGFCYQQLGETEKSQADFTKAKELGYNA